MVSVFTQLCLHNRVYIAVFTQPDASRRGFQLIECSPNLPCVYIRLCKRGNHFTFLHDHMILRLYTTRDAVHIQNLEKTVSFKITIRSLNTFHPKLIQTLLIFYFKSFMNDVKANKDHQPNACHLNPLPTTPTGDCGGRRRI